MDIDVDKLRKEIAKVGPVWHIKNEESGLAYIGSPSLQSFSPSEEIHYTICIKDKCKATSECVSNPTKIGLLKQRVLKLVECAKERLDNQFNDAYFERIIERIFANALNNQDVRRWFKGGKIVYAVPINAGGTAKYFVYKETIVRKLGSTPLVAGSVSAKA